MSDVSSNNKRIVKNTMMLYIRMFLIMGVSLYTSRVILKALGVEDYGIYNVVGGIVSMMGIIKGVMAGATSRYLNFALGKNDPVLAKKAFSVNFAIYVLLGIAFILIAETLGLWFLNTQLVIPDDRMTAANWVFQFTIISSVNQMLASPYNAAIIAHERMNVFAYISIFEVIIKLLIVFILFVSPIDKLVLYGAMIMLADLAITEIYRVFCRRHYQECHVKVYRDKAMYKEVLSYSSWNLFGQIAHMVKGQGLNVLLNMFFNPAINASRALSYQINNAINQFVKNFYTAVVPQITKYYAKNEMENMFNLVCRSSKLSFYLFCILAVPFAIEAPNVIQLWLGQLPENVIPFVRIILAISLLDCMQTPLKTVAQATGKVAKYELTIGIITIMNIPISYTLLKVGMTSVTVFVVSFVLSICSLIARLVLLKQMVDFPVKRFLNSVLLCGCLSVGLACIIPVALHVLLENTYMNSILIILIDVVCTLVLAYFIGLNQSERLFVKEIINNKIRKKCQ